MTWTRLFYIRNIDKAIQRVIPGEIRQQLPISRRYQAEMKKQYRIHGVPWIYDLKQPKANPRDKLPKVKKSAIAKAERLLKIQKNLAESEQKKIDFRQQQLNKRMPGGLDKVLMKGLPSWIKGDGDIPAYLKKKNQADI